MIDLWHCSSVNTAVGRPYKDAAIVCVCVWYWPEYKEIVDKMTRFQFRVASPQLLVIASNTSSTLSLFQRKITAYVGDNKLWFLSYLIFCIRTRTRQNLSWRSDRSCVSWTELTVLSAVWDAMPAVHTDTGSRLERRPAQSYKSPSNCSQSTISY